MDETLLDCTWAFANTQMVCRKSFTIAVQRVGGSSCGYGCMDMGESWRFRLHKTYMFVMKGYRRTGSS